MSQETDVHFNRFKGHVHGLWVGGMGGRFQSIVFFLMIDSSEMCNNYCVNWVMNFSKPIFQSILFYANIYSQYIGLMYDLISWNNYLISQTPVYNRGGTENIYLHTCVTPEFCYHGRPLSNMAASKPLLINSLPIGTIVFPSNYLTCAT